MAFAERKVRFYVSNQIFTDKKGNLVYTPIITNVYSPRRWKLWGTFAADL